MGLAELFSSAGTGLTNAWDSIGTGFTNMFGGNGGGASSIQQMLAQNGGGISAQGDAMSFTDNYFGNNIKDIVGVDDVSKSWVMPDLGGAVGWFGDNSEGIKAIGGLAGSMSTIYNTNRKNNMMENYYNTETANTAKDRQESDDRRDVLSSIWDGTYKRNTAGADQSTMVS